MVDSSKPSEKKSTKKTTKKSTSVSPKIPENPSENMNLDKSSEKTTETIVEKQVITNKQAIGSANSKKTENIGSNLSNIQKQHILKSSIPEKKHPIEQKSSEFSYLPSKQTNEIPQQKKELVTEKIPNKPTTKPESKPPNISEKKTTGNQASSPELSPLLKKLNELKARQLARAGSFPSNQQKYSGSNEDVKPELGGPISPKKVEKPAEMVLDRATEDKLIRLKSTVESDPKNKKGWIEYGNLCLEIKKYSEAAKAGSKAYDIIDKDSESSLRALYIMKEAYTNLKDNEKLLKTLAQIVPFNPSDTQSAVQLIEGYIKIGKASYIIRFLDKIQKIFPDKKQLYKWYALGWRDSESYSTEAYYLKLLLEMDPNDKETLIALAKSYEDSKSFDQALEIYQKLGNKQKIAELSLKKKNKDLT